MSSPRIEVYMDAQNRWRWRCLAANGEIVCSGEDHRDSTDAGRGYRDALAAMVGASAHPLRLVAADGSYDPKAKPL